MSIPLNKNEAGRNTGPNAGHNGSALEGVRIIDLTSVVMGPYATQVLADYGADVIKVETPTGDSARTVAPMRHAGMGNIHLHLNRNKRSIVLDLAKPECLEAFFVLIESVDAIVTNVRPAGLARLGITHESLKSRNPGLIWVSLVGFGSDGPYAGRPAYDDILQGLTAMPGLLAQAGGGRPQYVPLAYNDRVVGLHACIALLAALQWRTRSGLGQLIEVPMFETMVQFVLGDHLGGASFEPAAGPMGHGRSLSRERRPFATKDGHVCVVMYNLGHWANLLRATDQHDRIKNDARLQSHTSLVAHNEQLFQELAEVMRTRTTREWLKILEAADIPASPMHTLESVLEDEHLQAVNMFEIVDHATEGPIRQIKPPTRWSESPPSGRMQAPTLGQHTTEVLREIGMSTEKIEVILGLAK